MDFPQTDHKVFISYRRDDTAAVAGRLYDRLAQKFGAEKIFKDTHSIPVGVNFKTYIADAISSCDIILVVIGENWLNLKDGTPRRLIETDFVRIEIEEGLSQSKIIIPIYSERVLPIHETELPISITEILHINGMTIRHDPDFHSDTDNLIAIIESYFNEITEEISRGNPNATKRILSRLTNKVGSRKLDSYSRFLIDNRLKEYLQEKQSEAIREPIGREKINNKLVIHKQIPIYEALNIIPLEHLDLNSNGPTKSSRFNIARPAIEIILRAIRSFSRSNLTVVIFLLLLYFSAFGGLKVGGYLAMLPMIGGKTSADMLRGQNVGIIISLILMYVPVVITYRIIIVIFNEITVSVKYQLINPDIEFPECLDLLFDAWKIYVLITPIICALGGYITGYKYMIFWGFLSVYISAIIKQRMDFYS